MIGRYRKEPPLPATDSGPNPGDFPVGSLESRAAARMRLATEQEEPVMAIEVRHIGSKAPMGPWKKQPSGMWIREQLTTGG
jgi:hypothetical protein